MRATKLKKTLDIFLEKLLEATRWKLLKKNLMRAKKKKQAKKKHSWTNIFYLMKWTCFLECFFYLPKLTVFFFGNRQQFNARAGQIKTHVCSGNARPKSNACAHLKQRKKHSGPILDLLIQVFFLAWWSFKISTEANATMFSHHNLNQSKANAISWLDAISHHIWLFSACS